MPRLISGTRRADTLRGDDLDNIIIGGRGNDTLYGGPGADTFVFNTNEGGTDRIMDFNVAEGDRIMFRDDVTVHYSTGRYFENYADSVLDGLQIDAYGRGHSTIKLVGVLDYFQLPDGVIF